jgi:hypothetical protein
MVGLRNALALLLPLALAAAAPEGARASTSIAAKCVGSQAGFKPADGKSWYEVALKNSCPRRLLCTIDASVTDAKGVHAGKGSVALAAGSKDKPSDAVYRMEVGAAGGTAQIDFSCK